MDFDILDHLPILLRYNPNVDRSNRSKCFRFENMWFTDPSCKDVVIEVWSRRSHPDAVENLLLQLENCSNELIKWNQDTFRHVGNKI